MRLILAFSIAVATPAMASASVAEARPAPPWRGAATRPAPPPARTHAGRATPAPAVRSGRPAPGGAGAQDAPISVPLDDPASPDPGTATPSDAPDPDAPAASPGSPAGAQVAHSPTRLTLRSTAGSAAPRTVTLQCDPVGGTHPKAAQACADLSRARSDFTVDPAAKNPRACFMIYSPVVASAEGQWRGEAVKFNSRYPNTCVLRSRTGSIFDF
jgi:Subtilisin inhibitor-like